jgi:threonine synthase
MDLRPVYTPGAPRGGHYSQAIVHDGLIWLSGQIPVDPALGPPPPVGNGPPPGDVADQTRRVLVNLEAVLRAAGSSPAHVLRCNVYVADIEMWPVVNAAYAEFFSVHSATPPARTIVPTGPLHYGYAIEIDAVAALPDQARGHGPARAGGSAQSAPAALVCRATGERYPVDAPLWRSPRGGTLDLDFEARFPLDAIRRRPMTMWRYREAIPVDPGEHDQHIVSLGEPVTPLLEFDAGQGSAARRVMLKLDSLFPSGSYKDRGNGVLVSHARRLGLKHVMNDSSGNAGSSLAMYCARAGIGCTIYAPASTSPGKLTQIRASGAQLVTVPGTRQDTADAAWNAATDPKNPVYYASHCRSPFFLHGTKTFAYELCEQLGWRAPDAVVIPTGHGTLLLGCHIGFEDLRRAGVIERVPRLIAVQAEACAPLAAAFASKSSSVPAITPRDTIAEGIAIAAPVRAEQCLDAVRSTGGRILAISDDRTKAALKAALAKGLFIEPTSAIALAALDDLTDISGNITVAITGQGLKTTSTIKHLL